MDLVFFKAIDDKKAIVTLVHHKPELLTEEERVEGFKMQEFPVPEQREGFYGVAYMNLETMQPYFEYVEKPLTPEEIMQKEIEKLRAEIEVLKEKQ